MSEEILARFIELGIQTVIVGGIGFVIWYGIFLSKRSYKTGSEDGGKK